MDCSSSVSFQALGRKGDNPNRISERISRSLSERRGDPARTGLRGVFNFIMNRPES
jgi:hypothetical protein